MLLMINQIQKDIALIDIKISRQINYEHSLEMQILVKTSNSLAPEKNVIAGGEDINVGDIIEIDKQLYTVYETESQGLGKHLKTIYANYVSYKLNESKITEIKGDFSLTDVINKVLENSPFTLGKVEVLNPIIRYVSYKEQSKRETLLKIANDYEVELDFDNYTLNIFSQIGADKGVTFKYAKNLKSITKTVSSDGVGYKISIVELRDILGDAEVFDLGDTVEIIDESIGVKTKQRILKIEYNPFRRINTNIEVGQVSYQFADYYLEDMQNQKEETEQKLDELKKEIEKKIEEIVIPEPDKLAYNQIVQVTKETVLCAETIHSTTAWIEELEVNYLRTNFDARKNNKGGSWDYIYIHDMQIDFITANLSATETERYTIVSGRPIYWTAIADNADAYKYFTLQQPSIPKIEVNEQGQEVDEQWKKDNPNAKTRFENTYAIFDGVKRQVQESDFYVLVPKILESYTKMQIKFEQDNLGHSSPNIIFGYGNGQGENGGKAKIYKDTKGLAIEYNISDNDKKTLYLNGDNCNMRNIAVNEKLPQDTSVFSEGDIVFVIEDKV